MTERIFVDTDGNQYHTSGDSKEGGQGLVFFSDDSEIAIKYVPDDKTNLSYDEFGAQLDEASGIFISRKARIVRPIANLESPHRGYVMRFLEGGKAINTLMKFESDNAAGILREYNASGGLKRRLLLLKDLSKTLHYIHSAGAVFGDISDNNVFMSNMKTIKDLSQDNTRIQLIDADNLRIGQLDSALYTTGYGAPEVVKGIANTTQSDLYSFALLAYVLLNINNPFDGVLEEDDCWDAEPSDTSDESAEEGGKAFIYDSKDTSNHAGIGMLPWQFGLTEKLYALFQKSFSYRSRKNYDTRPSAAEWYTALAEACESTFYCKQCDAHHYPNCSPCGNQFEGYYAIVETITPTDDGYKIVYQQNVTISGFTEIFDSKSRLSSLDEVAVLSIQPGDTEFVVNANTGYSLKVFSGEYAKTADNSVTPNETILVSLTTKDDEYVMRIKFAKV